MRRNGSYETALKVIKNSDPTDYLVLPVEQKDRVMISVFIRDGSGQSLMDALQQVLEDESDWRIYLEKVEATAPSLAERSSEEAKKAQKALREEIYSNVDQGAKMERDYFLLVALSTIVAATGMVADSVAGVIGSMVIAPLLGPIIAFGLGAALGNRELLFRGLQTLVLGVGLVLVLSFALSFVLSVDLNSRELAARAEVRLDGLALSLAAGGAAALSISKGQSTALVGVMVAAALLPPATAIGLFLGDGRMALALRAALLFSLNAASLVLSALVVFRLKGVKPRGWIEQKHADRAVFINAGLSIFFLILAAVLIKYLDLGARIDIG